MTIVSAQNHSAYFRKAVINLDLSSVGSWTSRKDANYFADLNGKKMEIVSSEWDDTQVDLIKIYNGIFAVQ